MSAELKHIGYVVVLPGGNFDNIIKETFDECRNHFLTVTLFSTWTEAVAETGVEVSPVYGVA